MKHFPTILKCFASTRTYHGETRLLYAITPTDSKLKFLQHETYCLKGMSTPTKFILTHHLNLTKFPLISLKNIFHNVSKQKIFHFEGKGSNYSAYTEHFRNKNIIT